MNEQIEQLKWKRYKVGSDGFICLVAVMGDDSSIVQAARVSYGAGTKKTSTDSNLIRYLYRHGHTTPFEMVEFKFLIRVPMETWRQWIRHRTANVNEYSTRYSEAIDSAAITDFKEWRLQDNNNKQGSNGCLQDNPGAVLSCKEHDLLKTAREIYEDRLKQGVAREQARKDLPLSTYTEAYWKCDLRNIFNFLSLRMDNHAQKEIREYANAMYEIVKLVCPAAISAFDDYDHRRSGLLLSVLDVLLIQDLNGLVIPINKDKFYEVCERRIMEWPRFPETKCRERDECWQKLVRMRLATENNNETTN